jgi:hypothetical protein
VVHTAFPRLIKRTQEVAVAEVLGQLALFETHRKEQGKKLGTPFNSRMNRTRFGAYVRH